MDRRLIILSLAAILTNCTTRSEAPCGAICSYDKTPHEEILADVTLSAGGNVPYSAPSVKQTKAPRGYEVCYISHFGRHGSRYESGDDCYKPMLDLLEDADSCRALTPSGKDLLEDMKLVWEDAYGKPWSLAPLGVEQHRGIAERMYLNNKPIFRASTRIQARSTDKQRTILSMDAFCERLKELKPSLKISREAHLRYTSYLCTPTPEHTAFRRDSADVWKSRYKAFCDSTVKTQRLVESIFCDSLYVSQKVDPYAFASQLYELASILPNCTCDVRFWKYFEPEELYHLWNAVNTRSYITEGVSHMYGSVPLSSAKVLLDNILQEADEALESGEKRVSLRFGHDGEVMRLTGILRLEGCYYEIGRIEDVADSVATYRMTPMAANVQFVFYRKRSDNNDILVKVMHNEYERHLPIETDMYPYYKWSDVRSYFESLLN